MAPVLVPSPEQLRTIPAALPSDRRPLPNRCPAPHQELRTLGLVPEGSDAGSGAGDAPSSARSGPSAEELLALARAENRRLQEESGALQARVRAALDTRARGRPQAQKDLARLEGADARYRLAARGSLLCFRALLSRGCHGWPGWWLRAEAPFSRSRPGWMSCLGRSPIRLWAVGEMPSTKTRLLAGRR